MTTPSVQVQATLFLGRKQDVVHLERKYYLQLLGTPGSTYIVRQCRLTVPAALLLHDT